MYRFDALVFLAVGVGCSSGGDSTRLSSDASMDAVPLPPDAGSDARMDSGGRPGCVPTGAACPANTLDCCSGGCSETVTSSMCD